MHISLDRLADCSRMLGEPLRLLILRLLMEGELCVCEITAALDEPQYKVSRHLGILKRTGLLRDRREGTWILYSLDPDLPVSLRNHLASLKIMLDDDPRVVAMLGRLRPSPKRQPVPCLVCNGESTESPSFRRTAP